MPKDRFTKTGWSEDPPDATPADFITLIRAPAKGSLKLICLSDALIGRATHFFGGRTIPCIDGNCPAHDAGMASRWLGWLACVNKVTRENHLLEVTHAKALLLKEQRQIWGRLRGLQIEVFRPSGIANGRVAMRFHGLAERSSELGPAPDVIRCLERIWNIRPEASTSDTRDEDGPLSEAEEAANYISKKRNQGSPKNDPHAKETQNGLHTDDPKNGPDRNEPTR